MATMSLQAAYDQARSYLEANKVEQAIGVAQHILEYFPENLEAHRILGEAYLAGRQFDRAETAFGRVLHSDPENIPAHVGLAITYERQGVLDRAVSEFEQALEVRPDMPEIRSQLLRLYTDIWGSEGATLRLSRPGLARLYAKGHMLPQAIQEFRSVIDEQPERFDARVGLAEALWRDGQEQAAAEICEQILDERPDVLKANLLLGYIRLANSDSSGEAPWRLAQQLDPYQTVARALFESLPDVAAPELSIPAWDEEAFFERRARNEAERNAAVAPAAATATAAAATVAATDDDLFGDSWLDLPAQPAAQSDVDGDGAADENDDFLAALLALDTPPLPAASGVDLDSSSGVTPFSIDDLGGTTPPAGDLEPFSLNDLGLSDEELAALNDERDPQPAQSELAPIALDDLNLSDDELARLQADPAAAPRAEPELTPFSLADLGLSDDELARLQADPAAEAPAAPRAEPELTPFSLADLGLSDDEIAQLNAAEAPADAPKAEPELTPFSLEDLGLSDDEIAQLNASEAPAASQAEPGLTPFSLEDLGLSDDEIAQLNASEPPAASQAEPGLTPFSLADLGLSDDEIAQLNAASPGSTGPAPDADLADLEPFDWASLDVADEPVPEPAVPADDLDAELRSLQPFSLDDLDLNAVGDDAPSASLPSSLKPFSLDEAAAMAAAMPPVEPSEQDDTPGYSWQQPAAKAQTDFLRREEPEAASGSIFERLRRAAADRPLEDEPPLPEVSDEEAAAAGYFSNDDVSLRDEDTTSERFTGSFRLPREGEAADLPPAAGAAGAAAAGAAGLIAGAAAGAAAARPAAEPAAAEPELTPFSLEELGLSPDEIAQLEQTQGGTTSSTEPELTPFSLEELGLSPDEIAQLEQTQGGTTSSTEPELTPFSLEELGLSPDEIAALGAATSAPATGDTIVPGWSQGEELQLTPFSLDDPAPADDPATAGVTPFSFDDFGFDAPGGDDPATAGVTPFSLDDLGLDTPDTPAVAAAPGSPELRLSAEELAGLDLGPFEALAAEQQPEDPDAALNRLMELGQNRGWVDLTDIIAVVSDPEAEAERIEEIGWALHRMGVEIRDGDEVIDMEEGDAEDEIAILAADTSEVEPVAAPVSSSDAEPDLTPFSLEELGLSPEEIAALGLSEVAPAAAPTNAWQPADAEPELTPFSLEDLGLSPDEIAQLEQAQGQAAEQAAPTVPGALGVSPGPSADAEPELTPFSLEDLGLSADEIAQLEQAQGGTNASAEPELTPFSLEDLGLSADEIAQLEQAQGGTNASAEPELTPFSLEDLGLSPDEIAQLEQAQGGTNTTAEPELTPFSLEDLGLSPDEIAQLEQSQAAGAAGAAGAVIAGAAAAGAAADPAKPSAPADDDSFDFAVAEAAPVAKATKRSEPRVEEPPPPADPADAGFVAEPLDSLDTIWQMPAPAPQAAQPAREEPARAVLPPLSERPARREPPPAERPAPRPAPSPEPYTPVQSRPNGDGGTRRSTRSSTRGSDLDRYARREALISQPARALTAAKAFADYVPTGDEQLDEYLVQLDTEPDNLGLALAIGRLSAQTERPELMAQAYKGVLRDGQAVEVLTEELEELADTVGGETQRRLFKLLGDAYSRQGRLRDAMSAYNRSYGR